LEVIYLRKPPANAEIRHAIAMVFHQPREYVSDRVLPPSTIVHSHISTIEGAS
jgi:hypothetical protein